MGVCVCAAIKGDVGATALGNALGQLPALRGANLRLSGSFATDPKGIHISAGGLSNLTAGLARSGGSGGGLISLALMLGDGVNDLGDAGVVGLANNLGTMRSLEALWLKWEDSHPYLPTKASPLQQAVANLTRLVILHSDIHCLYCTEEAPVACGSEQGTLVPHLHGARCVECKMLFATVAPRKPDDKHENSFAF